MCSLYKRVKSAGKVCIILYIRSVIKLWVRERAGKVVKSCGKVYSSLYIEYIIKEYKGKQRCRKKVAGKVSVGKSVLFLYIDIV